MLYFQVSIIQKLFRAEHCDLTVIVTDFHNALVECVNAYAVS